MSKHFVVENGILVPRKMTGRYVRRHSWVSLVEGMGVGDSVLVRQSNEVSALLILIKKRYGTGSSVSRKMPDGLRVWRIK